MAETPGSQPPPMTEAQIQAAHVGPVAPLAQPIRFVEYDPQWPHWYSREAERIRAALDARVLILEHVGSTSVPHLAAKPVIDIVLAVSNSADEDRYVPDLEAARYRLHVREPDWHEHRMFKGPDTDINLHVFSVECAEIQRMLRFRDWLRVHAEDRTLYERTKHDLASREWRYVQNYADAKSAVVGEILARAARAKVSPRAGRL